MNTMKKLGGVALLTLTAPLAPALLAEEAATQQPAAELEKTDKSPFSVEVSLDVLSDYVWRGMICNGNPVWQPSVTAGLDLGDFGSIAGNVWQSYDLTHKRGTATNSRRSGGLQEIDYTLSYSVELAGVGFEVGHIFYTFPNNNGHHDQDLYATVSYDNPIVTPRASAYWNYADSADNDVSCLYYSLGLSHDFEVTEKLTVSPSASLGFGGNAWTDCGTEITDQTVGVSASYAITDYLSVSAQVNYTWIPSHELRKADYMGCGKDQLVWGGVNMTLSF